MIKTLNKFIALASAIIAAFCLVIGTGTITVSADSVTLIKAEGTVAEAGNKNVVKATDGNWYYTTDTNLQAGDSFALTTYTGLAQNDNGWYRIKNGIKSSTTGIISGTVNGVSAKWYVKDGEVKLSKTGFVNCTVNGVKAYWYIKNGKLTTFTGVLDATIKSIQGLYHVSKGKAELDRTGFIYCTINNIKKYYYFVNGLFSQTTGFVEGTIKDKTGYWYISSGTAQTSKTGFVYGTVNGKKAYWYVDKGTASTKTGFVYGTLKGISGMCYIYQGRGQYSKVGLVTSTVNGEHATWYVNKGVIDYYSECIVNGTINGVKADWYVKDGRVQVSFSDNIILGGTTYVIENGRVVASETEHTWVENSSKAATCTEDGEIVYICDVCQELKTEVVPATGHNFIDGICTNCGILDSNHNHSYTHSIINEATCTEEGLAEYRCVCGDSYTETIPKTEHISDNGTVVKEPTCQKTGSKQYKCTICGTVIKTETLPKTTHTEVSDDAVQPTCTSTGLTEGSHCSVCGEILTQQEIVPATGHNFVNGKCTVCGEKDGEHIHHYNESITKEATCTEEGVKLFSCVCGESYTEKIPKTEHVTELRNVKESTCQEKGYSGDEICIICGTTVSLGKAIEKSSHTADDGIITKDPTCTEAGVKTYKCSFCNEIISTEEIPATGHFPVTDPPVMATCTTSGLAEGSHCSVCGEIIKSQKVIPATGHNFVNGYCSVCGEKDDNHVHDYSVTVLQLATCTEEGLLKYECLCGHSYTEVTPKIEHTTKLQNQKDPSCTEEGYTGDEKCIVCGTIVTKGEVIPKTEHTSDEGTVTKEPTCTTEGEKTFKCTVCDEIIKTEKISSKGHISVVDNAIAPTCTESGLTEGSHCSVCGEILTQQEVVPAAGHNYVNGFCSVCGEKDANHVHNYVCTVITPATCIEEGLAEYECVCGVAYTEHIPKTSHISDKGTITHDASCTEEGEKIFKCVVCDEVIKTETIKAKGHTVVVDNAIAPTCTESGLTEGSHCSVCGEVITVQETVPALGHNYGSWVTTQPATCTEAGIQERTCSNCNCKETKSIEATGHSYTSSITKQPTCTVTGIRTYTCSLCGDKYTETIPAKGHTIFNDSAIAATKSHVGLTAGKHCSVCGKIITAQTIIPKLSSAQDLTDGQTKVLFVGNAITYSPTYNPTFKTVFENLASSGGKNLYAEYCVFDNARWSEFANFSGTRGQAFTSAVQSQNWDYVIFQQYTDYAMAARTKSKGYIKTLANYVRTNCPSAKILLNCTWAYDHTIQDDFTSSSEWSGDPEYWTYDEQIYYMELMYEAAAEDIGAEVIYSGRVFDGLYKREGLNPYAANGNHPNNIGVLANAASIYKKIFHENPSKATSIGNTTSANAKIIKTYADHFNTYTHRFDTHVTTYSDPLVICIDPGHGGSDNGSTLYDGSNEKVLTLKLANMLKTELETYADVRVIMTRTTDTDMSLKERAQYASNNNADFLISVHSDAYNGNYRGYSVFYPNVNYRFDISSIGKVVANNIASGLANVGLSVHQGVTYRNITSSDIETLSDQNAYTYSVVASDSQNNIITSSLNGAKYTYGDYYGVIRNSKQYNVPTIIVEHGFGDNKNDFETFLNTDAKLKNLAVADANAIAASFSLVKAEDYACICGAKPSNAVADNPSALPAVVTPTNPVTKILMIGNSLTYSAGHNSTAIDVFKKLAAGGNHNIELTYVANDGETLQTYANFNTAHGLQAKNAIDSKSWDYVILQDNTGYPSGASGSSLIEVSKASIRTLNSYIKSKCPNAKVLLNATWPWVYDNGQTMINYGNKTAETLTSVAQEIGAGVIYSGWVFVDLYFNTSYNPYQSDGNHPSAYGVLANASCIYKKVFNEHPSASSYNGNVTNSAAITYIKNMANDVNSGN